MHNINKILLLFTLLSPSMMFAKSTTMCDRVENCLPLAKKNNANAQFILGALYYDGAYAKQSFEDAIFWWTKAGLNNHVEAQHDLGLVYDSGLGTEPDPKMAFRWFKKAATQHHTDAQYHVGKAYYEGAGTKRNYNKAFKWFEKAAYKGDDLAQFYLGQCYGRGHGTELNFIKAYAWFKIALETKDEIQGVDLAHEIYIRLDTKQKAKAKALTKTYLAKIKGAKTTTT